MSSMPVGHCEILFWEIPSDLHCAPLLLLAPLARNTIVLLYDLRRELGKVLPLFSPELLLYPLPSVPFRPLPRFCDFDHISYIITLLISDSSEVRRFHSYDFYPVNNVDFSMMSSRLWTRIGNLPRSTENLKIWLSYLRNIWRARRILYLSAYDFLSACIFSSIFTRKRIPYKL